MATRPIWNGVISFGVVTIPVGLHTAIDEQEVHFHQLHKPCGARIRYQKYCPVHERVVENNEIERGFEVSKGQYVVVTDEDLDTLPIPSKNTIEVTAFVKVSEVDPLYFDKPYYVEPNTAGKKPLGLLIRALVEKGVAALGKVALRNRESLCLLRVSGDSLVLETLHWPDEIRQAVDVAGTKTDVDPKQLKLAESLIDLLAEEFDPKQYHDQYREALEKLIEAKAEGHKLEVEPEAPPTEVIDLMDALRKSVETAKAKRKSG